MLNRQRQGGKRRSFLLRAKIGFASVLVLAPFLSSTVARGGEAPTFQATTAQGKQHSGPLLEIAGDWSVKLGGPFPIEIPGQDFISLRLHKSALTPFPLTPHLVLASGDRIPIDVKKGVQFRDNHFHVHPAPPLQTGKGETLSIPSSAVAAFWLQTPQEVAQPEKFLRQLLKQERSSDLVLLQNGDLAEGIFVELDSAKVCKLKFGQKYVTVPFDRIAVLAFNPLFLVQELPKNPYGHLVLANGCRLSLQSIRLGPEKQLLSGKTLFQADVQVTLKDVACLDLYQGAAVYLSDLKPEKFTHTPFFGVSWPFVPDGAASGSALKLGSDTFDRGLGLHSGSEITYALNGKYRWFEALVGLDETGGKVGGARIEILLDGRPQNLAGKSEFTRGDPPVRVRLALGGAKALTLKVGYSRWGDVGGHVNWAGARFIKN